MAIGKSSKVRDKNRLQCEFETMGNECILIGDISPGGGEGSKFYCAFHYDVITKGGRFLNSYGEFIDWLEEYKTQFPVEKYGTPQYDDRGYFTGYKMDQFHKYEKSHLWRVMGNRD